MGFKRIIHISDIHIRAGDSQVSRFKEYKRQIDNLLSSVKSFDPETSLVVLTGDIFEHKHTLGPSGQLLAQHLFRGLSSLFTTVVIRGNHDYRQDQPDEPDLINPFFQEESENLHYIDESGLHQFDNIEFGIVVVQDTLIRGAKGGINAELPEFPTPSEKSDELTHRIALFHGSVGGSLLQNGRPVEERNNYPLRTWIKGYDAVLLGDIHLQQVHSAKLKPGNDFLERKKQPLYVTSTYTLDTELCPWAYAGSLIQQNAGESPWGHGFIVWDLETSNITSYHLRNETGIVVVGLNELQEPRVKIRVGKKDHSLSIETATSLGWFPRSITLKFNPNARQQVQTILSLFEEANIKVLSTGFQDDVQQETEITVESKTILANDLSALNSPDEWIKFFSETTEWAEGEWSQWIRHPHLLSVPNEVFPPEIATKIQDRNTKFQKTTDVYLNGRDVRPPIRTFRIHYLEFSWLLCFGSQNYVNFDTFIKKVCLINGNNGSGKSSLLEILGIAIYGESFPSRYSKTFSASIINQHKPKEEHAAYTKICFSVDNKKYWIHRTFDPQQGNPKNVWQRYIRLIDNETGEIIKQNANTVNPWVKEHIGLYEHFLLTTIMTQSSDSDFFALDAKEQKAIIDSLLQLDVCETFRALLKEARLNHDYALTHLTTYESGLKGRVQTDYKAANISDLEDRLVQVSSQLEIVTEDLLKAKENLAGIPEKVFQYPLNYYESEYEKCSKIADVEREHIDITDIKEKRSRVKDRLAVLKSKKYVVTQNKSEKPEQSYDELEHKFNILKQQRNPIQNLRIYDKEAHNKWIQQNSTTPNKPQETVKELQKQQNQLKANLADYEIDEEEFKPISAKLLAGLEKQDTKLGQQLDQLDNDIKNNEKELARLKPSPQEEILVNKYKKASADLNEAFNCDYKEASKRMQDATALTQEAKHLQSELDSMGEELQTIATIKYNQKCDECTKNPYRSKKEQLLEKQHTLQKKLQNTKKHITETLQTTTPYAELMPIFKACENIYSDKIVTLLSSVERIKELQISLLSMKKSYAEKEEEREDIQYEDLKTVNEYYQIKSAYEEASKNLEAAKYHDELSEWFNSKAAYELETNILEIQMEMLTAYSHEFNELTHALATYDKFVQEEETVRQAAEKMEEYAGIIEAYPSFLQQKELEKQYKPLTQEEASLKVRIETAKERARDLEAANSINDLVQKFRLYLEGRTKQVTTMEQVFEQFTDQLYPLKVGPAIEDAVNAVLSTIELPRPIKLKAVWESGGFEWFMEDGDSIPPYEKCSGAQRFFAGFALRIAFGRMGASNMINSQFFLDEGFTACDVETMERVPSLLKGLLKDLDYMQTIFIVSHLDTLKTVADESIMITRGAQASRLQVGDHMDAPKGQIVRPEEEQKKRGRPKKSVAV